MKDVNDKFTTAVYSLGGDFTGSNNVRISKSGNIVTLTLLGGGVSHNFGVSATSSGFIPSSIRPSGNIYSSYIDETGPTKIYLYAASGFISIGHKNWDGSNRSENVTAAFSISYAIA